MNPMWKPAGFVGGVRVVGHPGLDDRVSLVGDPRVPRNSPPLPERESAAAAISEGFAFRRLADGVRLRRPTENRNRTITLRA